MRFRVEVKCKSPVAISAGRATGNETESLRRIPGSVWRGALAAQLMEEWGLGEKFEEVFVRGQVRFGDLRLGGAKPWPLSARWCKLWEDGHPVRDLLIRTARKEELPKECSGPQGHGCGAKLDQPVGFVRLHGNTATPVPVPARVLAHSALSNSLLRVRQEQFFSQEVADVGEEPFEGELWAEGAAEEIVAGLCGERTIMIGRGGTRGLGLAELALAKKAEVDPEVVRGRFTRLNRDYQRPGYVVFSATLLSPCAVFDEWLFSRPQLQATDIDTELGDYEVLAAYSRMVRIAGWNAQAGLPKTDIVGIAPGSCFLFGREVGADGVRERERVAAILARSSPAVGEYQEEGMGEVELCSPFHFVIQ